jgi:hypothetical protein
MSSYYWKNIPLAKSGLKTTATLFFSSPPSPVLLENGVRGKVQLQRVLGRALFLVLLSS